MLSDKQSQKAGDNAQMLQAGVVNFYAGIDEKRAREICDETFAIARRDLTNEARACASQRVQQFEDVLLPRIQCIEGALNMFADPAFQFLLTSAQRTAAATERSADYDMLSELLACRILKGEQRKNRTGIKRALEIVGEVDDDALCALTVVHALQTTLPLASNMNQGLQVLEDMYSKLMYMDLPTGEDWIEQLDILDAVRISSGKSFHKLSDFYPEALSGYSAAGICVQSEEYQKAQAILSGANISLDLLAPNELLDGYVRLSVPNRDGIENIEFCRQADLSGEGAEILGPATAAEKNALYAVWDLYAGGEVKKEAESEFMVRWDSYATLNTLHQWWDALPTEFDITRVGTVLAHTNARRCDADIPELSLDA